MFKFLRKKNKQQSDQARAEEPGNADLAQPLNHLEEVLEPLFERIEPTSPEEYAGMYNINVIIIWGSQIVRAKADDRRYIC